MMSEYSKLHEAGLVYQKSVQLQLRNAQASACKARCIHNNSIQTAGTLPITKTTSLCKFIYRKEVSYKLLNANLGHLMKLVELAARIHTMYVFFNTFLPRFLFVLKALRISASSSFHRILAASGLSISSFATRNPAIDHVWYSRDCFPMKRARLVS